ncbi:GNAT family N-acetyltransferase [Devosia sp. ZB163]|uniref:GNAT family N-acetyltransferase n=1 Tax=Devosia sp. ZB163 TaxID=3025938 RepID=UPI002360ED01|nr:GNAT family N-acetyltransferase [Devosia sp. ZB163]MDC9823812.1 GNAT family N-acetyltransferase [Devosia sp. ZB163]
MDEYVLVERIPTVEEFCELRRLNGLTPKSAEAAARGLPNSVFAVVIEHEGRAIGMGRVIGDGGTAYQLTDIAVMGAYRGKGWGKRIVAALVGWLEANAPKSAYVSLIADGPAKELYAQFGFEETAPVSVGMARWIR